MEVKERSLAWLSLFPYLESLEPNARELLAKHYRINEAPKGKLGYSEGMPCEGYVLRLQGRSKVYKVSSGGKEILLYRVCAGETCVISTTCLLGNRNYPASTLIEEPVRDVIVPKNIFQLMMQESCVFRRFVLENYGTLISDLIVLLDEVAFQTIDARMAKLLLDTGNDRVARTHQQIADELGTAREVVSRQLKRFEKNGWLNIHRGEICLLSKSALQQIAN